MTSKDDWFRSADWDDDAQAEFERRLARARPDGRVQYRRIKGIALLESTDRTARQAGRAMLQENASDPDAAGFERTLALSLLGSHEVGAGGGDVAEPMLRTAIERLKTDPSGGSGLEPTVLAEILLRRGDVASLREAKALLDANLDDPPLLVRHRHRMCVAGARVAVALGDRRDARLWAQEALRYAAATHSGLRNHPRLGLFTAEGRTKAWLERVALDGSGQRSQ
jgi:hypothetical protein